MIGVGMIIAQHVEATLARPFFHPQLVEGVNQKAVFFRFPARVGKRKQFLRASRIVTEVAERNHLGHPLRVALRMAEQNSTALAGIIRGAMPADGFEVCRSQG